MGSIPQQKDITIEFDCQFRVNMGRSDFSSIMKAFLMLLPQLLEDFFQKVLVAFGEYEMAQDKKTFACKCCGNDTKFIWKTRHGKATTILTWFRYITLKQLQVECKACGSKQYITRALLGMEPGEEDSRRNAAQVGSDGRVDVLPCIGEARQDVRVGDRQDDDLEVGATGGCRDGFCSGRK